MLPTTPHIIESAFLLLAAFGIGGLLGFGLKRIFGPSAAKMREKAAPVTPKK